MGNMNGGDLKYSREREIEIEKIFTKIRPTGLKNRKQLTQILNAALNGGQKFSDP
jgi:hypothetical protein